MNKYGWGVDGYGRFHICTNVDRQVLLCMLPGNGGWQGVLMLQDQDDEFTRNTSPSPTNVKLTGKPPSDAI